MKFTKEDLVYFADKLEKTESKFFERFQSQILNPINASQLLSINKIVIDGDDNFVYRIGDYNSLLSQFYTIEYCNQNNIKCFLKTDIIFKGEKIIITRQKKVDYIVSDIKTAFLQWNQQDIAFLKDKGITGLEHNNVGYINDYPFILDWIGGPILVGKELRDWEGNVLLKIN